MPKKGGKATRAKSATRKKTKNSSKKRGRTTSPIPEGYVAVTPYLTVNGAAQAIDFYKKAFGAKELSRSPLPDGKIMNASLDFNGSVVMLADEFPDSSSRSPSSLGSTTVTLHIYSKDVDKLWQEALAAGARIAMPLDNQFWGERYGQLEDPFGHRWSMSMRIEMTPEEMESKRQAAMAMFAQGEHPGHQGSKKEQPPIGVQ